METLLIFVFLIGGAIDGGAATSVQSLQFKDSAACEAAAAKIRRTGNMWATQFVRGGPYRIDAVCVSGIR